LRRRSRRSIVGALLACTAIAVTPVLAACGDDAEETVQSVTSQAGSVASEATDRADSVASEATDGADSVASEATDGADSVSSEATDAAPGGGGDEGAVLEIPAAEQGLAFAKESETAPAGNVTLRMPNPAPLPHNIAIDLPEGQQDEIGEIVNQGGVSEVSAELEAGTYEYYCSVPGHREGGMVGQLTVQ